MSGSKHPGLTPGLRMGPTSLAVQVYTLPQEPRLERSKTPTLQIIEQILEQTEMEFYCLPDHTRTPSLRITDSKGKVLVSKVMCDDVNTHTLTTFRKP